MENDMTDGTVELSDEKEEQGVSTKWKHGRENNRPDWERYDRRPKRGRAPGRGRKHGRRRRRP